MTVSQWRRSSNPTSETCDALVIGAGIAGISGALELERRGLSVIVLERDQPGAGASGRNAGFLMRGCAENYAAACRDYGRERAKALWRLTEENLEALRAEGVERLPTVQRAPSCLLALEEQEREELRASAALLREDGFRVEWLEAPGDGPDDAVWRPRHGARRALAGLVNPDDGACNPVDVLALLTRKLRAPVRQRSEVTQIQEGPGGRSVVVRTAEGTIEAAHALLCANAYIGLILPEAARLARPTRGQMLAARFPEGSGVRLLMSYYANHGYEYFRQTRDGTVVVGGWRRRHADEEVGYEDRTTEPVQQGLEAFAAHMLGQPFEIAARWSGTMGFSPDGLPVVAPVGGFGSGRVWFCGGFTGHGMSMGFRTAQIAVGAMLGGAPNLFDASRFT